MTTNTLNLANLMAAIPKWPLPPRQIPYQFGAHGLAGPGDTEASSAAPLLLQQRWPNADRYRFFLSPDSRHFYRMGILASRNIEILDSGYLKNGEFQIMAPGMPKSPISLTFSDKRPTLAYKDESLALGPGWLYQDPTGLGSIKHSGHAVKTLVSGGAVLFDMPVQYRLQHLERIGRDEYLLAGIRYCIQSYYPEHVVVFRGRPQHMQKLQVCGMEQEPQHLRLITDDVMVRIPADSLLGLGFALAVSRPAIQALALTSGFSEYLLANERTASQSDPKMYHALRQFSLESGDVDQKEQLILAALGVDFGPFPTREAFEDWNKA